MASYQPTYTTTVEIRPSSFERMVRYLLAQLSAWLRPRLHRAGKFLLAELVRGVIATVALGFALVAAIYGLSYFFSFLTEVLTRWMPHWAALLIIATAMLAPAGIAALIGVWQLYKMRTVRATALVTAQAGAVIWTLTRRNRNGAKEF